MAHGVNPVRNDILIKTSVWQLESQKSDDLLVKRFNNISLGKIYRLCHIYHYVSVLRVIQLVNISPGCLTSFSADHKYYYKRVGYRVNAKTFSHE